MNSVLRELLPHDLVWGAHSDWLSEDAPDWAQDIVQAGMPVVIRRDQMRNEEIAVGVRGFERIQRYACWMPKSCIEQRIRPENVQALTHADAKLLNVLSEVRKLFQFHEWGITGSHAFEQVTGMSVTRTTSDLDVLLRLAAPISLQQAEQWIRELDALAVSVDVQVNTDNAGFSLKDWVSNPAQVLLKTNHGAVLTDSPWAYGGEA